MTQHTSISPLKKRPAYLLVFEALEDEILSGRLAEGDSIPTEMELCTQFAVQRSTIREGIRLLEQSGLVQRGSGKRLAVVRPKSSEAARTASRGLERHGVRFIDIWEAILITLPGTARLAAQKMSSEDMDQLEEFTGRLASADRTQEVVSLSIGYLEATYTQTGNRVFKVMLHSLNLLVQSSLASVISALPNAQQRILGAQRHMNQAFRARDGDLAAEWMERHVKDLRRGYEVAGVDLNSEVGSFDRAG